MTVPIILADLADLCTSLSNKATTLAKEAHVALDDNDSELARSLIGQSRGIQEAVTAVLAFIAARVEKENINVRTS